MDEKYIRLLKLVKNFSLYNAYWELDDMDYLRRNGCVYPNPNHPEEMDEWLITDKGLQKIADHHDKTEGVKSMNNDMERWRMTLKDAGFTEEFELLDHKTLYLYAEAFASASNFLIIHSARKEDINLTGFLLSVSRTLYSAALLKRIDEITDILGDEEDIRGS